jgi:hypothetical protein
MMLVEFSPISLYGEFDICFVRTIALALLRRRVSLSNNLVRDLILTCARQ